MLKFIRNLAAAGMIGMLFVTVGGALVTKTDSGLGCGDDWPLCNGKFVPAYTIESFIEYSHRFVSGVVGVLVLLAFILVFMKLKHRKDAKFFASCTLFFTVLQAILGAMAVKWPQSDFVMATHFGFSLLAFSASLLLAFVVRDVHKHPKEQSWQLNVSNQNIVVGAPFRGFVWLTTLYCYVVVYLGALIRHTDSTSGCLGWPLCNGQWIPELTGSTGIAYIHRVASLLIFLVILAMAYIAIRDYGHSKEIRFSAQASVVLIVLLIFSGAAVVFSLSSDLAFLINSLIHTLIVTALFGILCYLSILSWQWRRSAPPTEITSSD